MLHQDPLDIAAFTAIDNFMLGQVGPIALNVSVAKRKFARVCEQLGFDLQWDRSLSEMSFSQRQQLEIARLVSMGVRVLILDEPTTGISQDQKALLFNALRRLAKEYGLVILLVSHKLQDVTTLCDRVVVLAKGKLTGEATMPVDTADLVTMMFADGIAQRDKLAPTVVLPLLRLEGLSVSEERITVERVDFRLSSGEVVGLAGMLGSGQQIFMEAIVGLVKPSHGKIVLGNTDLTRMGYLARMARGLIYGPSGRMEEGLIGDLTLVEHVALVTQGRWISEGDALGATRLLIETFDIVGTPGSKVSELSGGNQQRFLISLLMVNPRVLVIDQPTKGLDVSSVVWIWEQLHLAAINGAGIIVACDDLDELVANCDRLLVFYEGKVTEVEVSKISSVELGHMIGGLERRKS
jgi:simple sugar transport system ATP-binding protein